MCLCFYLSVTYALGQNEKKIEDSCLFSFPSILTNPSPLYSESSERIGFKSGINLDSFTLYLFDSSGKEIAKTKQLGIIKNEYIDLSNCLQNIINPNDLIIEEIKIPIFWKIKYWRLELIIKENCVGRFWLLLSCND